MATPVIGSIIVVAIVVLLLRIEILVDTAALDRSKVRYL